MNKVEFPIPTFKHDYLEGSLFQIARFEYMNGKSVLIKSSKRVIKDSLSILRQSLGLPHNKTRKQIIAIKEAFDPVEIEKQRIAVIARATGHSEPTIRAIANELGEPEWDEIYCMKQWNERGASMMSARDRKSLYTLVRSLTPNICLETGVGGGCSSTYILSALERNGLGKLLSIDVSSPYESRYGELIPTHLRHRWELRIEYNSALLPKLLEELQVIDFFFHDSQHTFRHMTWEYELAWSHLSFGGCLASHDIITTTAFDDFKYVHRDEIVHEGKIGNFGFLVKGNHR